MRVVQRPKEAGTAAKGEAEGGEEGRGDSEFRDRERREATRRSQTTEFALSNEPRTALTLMHKNRQKDNQSQSGLPTPRTRTQRNPIRRGMQHQPQRRTEALLVLIPSVPSIHQLGIPKRNLIHRSPNQPRSFSTEFPRKSVLPSFVFGSKGDAVVGTHAWTLTF